MTAANQHSRRQHGRAGTRKQDEPRWAAGEAVVEAQFSCQQPAGGSGSTAHRGLRDVPLLHLELSLDVVLHRLERQRHLHVVLGQGSLRAKVVCSLGLPLPLQHRAGRTRVRAQQRCNGGWL